MTVAEVRELVVREGLLAHDRSIVAMLSGGRDSVCLLDVAATLCGTARVTALHVNYGLRPEADQDEHHCRELCARLGVEIEVLSTSRAEGASGNLHAWARALRYNAATELAERLDGSPVTDASTSASASAVARSTIDASVEDVSVNAPAPERARVRQAALIATGHTATDQVETILYRLAASPGRRSLLGMPASEGRLVRPLLGLTREQTGAYCLERQLAWREDASNDSERYARARVRHGLVKALDAVHPAAQANVLRTAELLREETELLGGLVDAELAGSQSIAIERLRQLPAALQRLVVIRLAEDAAGAFVPQAGERVAELLALGARGGRAELHVGGLAGAVIERGELRMQPIQRRPQHGGQ
jgi:tRNA(Ile)-lysidine synthase